MVSLLEKIRFDLYASVMGITGLGLAWRFAAQCFQWAQVIGEICIFTALSIFIMLNALNLARLLMVPQLIKSEWMDHDRFNFFPTFTISGSLLSMGVLPYSDFAALIIWWPTVLLQVLFITLAVRRWLTTKITVQNVSPAWLIPMVGNASPCFAGVPLGYGTFSYALLMSAIVCWMLFTPIILGKLIISKPETEPHIVPSIAILISAPAVISVGLYNYPDTANVLMQLLSYAALFFAAVTISMFRHFRIKQFSRALWAFTFPAAALSSSLLRIYHQTPDPYNLYQAWIALGLATTIVVLVSVSAVKCLVMDSAISLSGKKSLNRSSILR